MNLLEQKNHTQRMFVIFMSVSVYEKYVQCFPMALKSDEFWLQRAAAPSKLQYLQAMLSKKLIRKI